MFARFKYLCIGALVALGLTACDKEDKVELTNDQATETSSGAPAKVEQPPASQEVSDTKSSSDDLDVDTPPKAETDETEGVSIDEDNDPTNAETIAETKEEVSRRLEETLAQIEENMEDMDDETKEMIQKVRERAYEMINDMDKELDNQ